MGHGRRSQSRLLLTRLVGSDGSSGRPLDVAQARRVYERIGRFQDLQSIYEHRAVAELLAHADLEHAHAVFELGYGTGALAARLLGRHLPGDGRYTGIDLSPRMHELALERLRAYSDRVELRLSDGSLEFPFPGGVFDRFVSAYVLDLFSEEGIDLALREAARLLAPDGLLCLVGLTDGATLARAR
jgi:ubiquinone/menaquinone biosynthesis C-methylase UbiE